MSEKCKRGSGLEFPMFVMLVFICLNTCYQKPSGSTRVIERPSAQSPAFSATVTNLLVALPAGTIVQGEFKAGGSIQSGITTDITYECSSVLAPPGSPGSAREFPLKASFICEAWTSPDRGVLQISIKKVVVRFPSGGSAEALVSGYGIRRGLAGSAATPATPNVEAAQQDASTDVFVVRPGTAMELVLTTSFYVFDRGGP